MFVRFIVAKRHHDSNEPMGIFEAVDLLPRIGLVAYWHEHRLTELPDWFRVHLPFPDRLARSARPNATPRALSWFKTTATEHIAQARELAAVLDANDIRTEMLTAERPGFIVYEDECQVVAEPFRGNL